MSLKHALLGFLDYGPAAGYQLNQAMEQSVQHFWHANLSQIYPTLSQMEQEGLLTAEVAYQVDRPNRKVYQITDRGRAELRRWLQEPMDLPAYRLPFLIQLFFGAQLPKEELIALLRRQLDLHRQRLDSYQCSVREALERAACYPAMEQERPFWELTRRAGVKTEQAWISWCEEAIEEVEKMADSSRSQEGVSR